MVIIPLGGEKGKSGEVKIHPPVSPDFPRASPDYPHTPPDSPIGEMGVHSRAGYCGRNTFCIVLTLELLSF